MRNERFKKFLKMSKKRNVKEARRPLGEVREKLDESYIEEIFK